MNRCIAFGLAAIALCLTAPAPAAAASAITVADMRPVANKVTVRECARAQFIVTPRGRVRAYACTAVYADCRTHPPLNRSVGYCIASYRISTRKPSFLPDRACAAIIYMGKKHGITSVRAVPRWRCKDVTQSPPLPRNALTRLQTPGCASCPPPGPGPVYKMVAAEMRSHAANEELAACLRSQYFSIEHVRIKVYQCRVNASRPFCWVGAPQSVNHGSCVLAYTLTPVRSVLSHGRPMLPVKCRGVAMYKKIGPGKIVKVNLYWKCWKVNTNA